MDEYEFIFTIHFYCDATSEHKKEYCDALLDNILKYVGAHSGISLIGGFSEVKREDEAQDNDRDNPEDSWPGVDNDTQDA